jgi:putative transposase
VWAIDFQFNSATDGRSTKIFTVFDQHDRKCLGGLVERSIPADGLADEVNRLVGLCRRAPAVQPPENGPEMIAAATAE